MKKKMGKKNLPFLYSWGNKGLECLDWPTAVNFRGNYQRTTKYIWYKNIVICNISDKSPTFFFRNQKLMLKKTLEKQAIRV